MRVLYSNIAVLFPGITQIEYYGVIVIIVQIFFPLVDYQWNLPDSFRKNTSSSKNTLMNFL